MAVPTKEKDELIEEQEKQLPEEYTDEQPVQFSAQYTPQEEVSQAEPEQTPVQQFTEQSQEEQRVMCEQEEMTRRDREILAALDEVLQRNRVQNEPPRVTKHHRKDWHSLAVGVVKSGSGVLSLALTLIFMGIVLVCVTLSSQPDYLIIAKLSPIAAVLLGIELLLGWVVNRKKLRINIPCVGVIAVIVAGCCAMSASLNKSEATMLQGQESRVVEAEIYEASYKQLRHSVDILELTIKADLLPGSEKKTMDTLAAGDKVEISAVLDGTYADPLEFAAECRRIIEIYKKLEVPVESYHFSAETRLSSFLLDVDGLFQQDMSEQELSALVRYIYVEDYDYIQDIEDFTEEITQTSESIETIE